MTARLIALCALATAIVLPGQAADTLVGFARLPAATFADGPSWGQLASRQIPGQPLPLRDRQPVQGFSAVLPGPTPDTFYVLTDNGLGARANSADALLRLYAIKPDFRTASGGSGQVLAADVQTGAALEAFTAASHIDLNDAGRRLGLPLQADLDHLLGDPGKPRTDPSIRAGRLLTGADLDTESIRRDRQGHFWIGDEFGPFLVETDAQGRVLRAAIELPGVRSPDNPHLG